MKNPWKKSSAIAVGPVHPGRQRVQRKEHRESVKRTEEWLSMVVWTETLLFIGLSAWWWTDVVTITASQLCSHEPLLVCSGNQNEGWVQRLVQSDPWVLITAEKSWAGMWTQWWCHSWWGPITGVVDHIHLFILHLSTTVYLYKDDVTLTLTEIRLVV